ncbi:putative phosphate transporter [Ordospora pajunii]|uniref:putative phosphate transporter n=1 Tax=Ordospora pajunii TaxID=3039483 RepID=UPI0029528275|nr:putative phosphate transporter [Ordospora pajunii]KAH9411917.1 putative phosphate transporter [Ordospora pajunii]
MDEETFDGDISIQDIKKPPLSGADNAIVSNIVFQGFITGAILLVYIVLRKRTKWLYMPNIKNRPHHPCYGYTGFLSWIIPVVTVSDTALLTIIGLDAFMMLQTIKLLFRILLILSIFIIPSLGYLFWKSEWKGAEHANQFFVRLSLESIDPMSKAYGCIVPIVYMISLFIIYSIFIYYKRYIVLRQAYLRNPAIMTSIITLKKLSYTLGSAERSTEYMNLPNRTLIMSRLPFYINNDTDLFEFVDSLGVGEVDDCVLVYDTTILQKLYNEKDQYIHNIEKEIHEKLARINEWSEKNEEACMNSIPGFNKSIFNTVSDADIMGVFEDAQKQQLVAMFLNGAQQFSNLLEEGKMPKINFYLDMLNDVNTRINQEKEVIKNEEAKNREVRMIELVNKNHSLFLRSDISKDAGFFSFHHVFNFSKFKMYFTLDLPSKTKRGFVTFKDQRSANIVKQSQIGSRIFSVAAEDAPAPNNVMWENITSSEVENYIYSIFGTIFFIMFIALFSSMVAYMVTLLVSSEMLRESKFVSIFLDVSKHETITESLRGILFPLIYSSMLLFVPAVITALVSLEGIYSYSSFQQKLMGKLCNFLFFNGFVSVFFASSFYRLVVDVLFRDQKFTKVIETFSEESLESSVFFANTIIQRAFFGTAIILLKPGPLLINYLLIPFVGSKTRREKHDAEYSPPFDFGVMFPPLLTVFSMAIVYATMCPLILFLGAFFYACSYFAFKTEFLYCSRNEYESGGEYWDVACQNIMFSLIFFQVATFAKMCSDGRIYLAMMLFPIILMTFIFRNSLKNMFYKSCHYYPLNTKEEEYLDSFTEKMLAYRIELLESWSEMGGGSDADVLPLVELGVKDTKEIEKVSYYNDPNTEVTKSFLILPEDFFKIVWFLAKNDKDNIFGLRIE